MKIYNLFFLIFLFFLSSCSSLSQKLQNILETKNAQTPVEPKKITNYCENKSSIQSLLEDPQFFSSAPFKNSQLSFIEKSVLISLIEMERRPDIAGPYSRLQVVTKINGEFQYYDFRPKNLDDDTKISFLYGLDFLLKKNQSANTLSSIVNFIERSWPAHYLVSSDFEAFLSQNKNDIQKNPELSKKYLKGDEILTRFESFSRSNIQKSIIAFQKKKLFDNSLYDYSKNNLNYSNIDKENNVTKCNFDISKDSFTPDDVFFESEYSSHSFALSDKDNYFLAITSSHSKKPIELKDEFFFKARPAATPLPVCLLQNSSLNLDLVISSTMGRNPSQHIKHLIDYDLINSLSLEPLSHTLNFARHLFLTNPDRILYESKKGRKEQLNFFLQMNFPIYHVDQLGEIVAIANHKHNKHNSIMRDDRSNKQLTCIP